MMHIVNVTTMRIAIRPDKRLSVTTLAKEMQIIGEGVKLISTEEIVYGKKIRDVYAPDLNLIRSYVGLIL